MTENPVPLSDTSDTILADLSNIQPVGPQIIYTRVTEEVDRENNNTQNVENVADDGIGLGRDLGDGHQEMEQQEKGATLVEEDDSDNVVEVGQVATAAQKVPHKVNKFSNFYTHFYRVPIIDTQSASCS